MGGCCSTGSAGVGGGGSSSKGPREATILVIGLDNSGKTTLTHAINGGECCAISRRRTCSLPPAVACPDGQPKLQPASTAVCDV